MSRVLLLGLDGMTYSVLTPAFDEGHMPVLRRLLSAGVSGTLTSTVPPYTPPGWTSIFTGVNPGRHGIFGFTLGNVQRNDGLVSLDRVKAPALWNAVNAQGGRIGLFNIPMTYPPPPVDGWSISGMLTPEGGAQTPEGFTHPDDLAKVLVEAAGTYAIDIDVDYDQDWRSTAIIDRLSANLEAKRRGLRAVLEKDGDLTVLFAVLEAPDRVFHVHYKYLDPACAHYTRPEAAAFRERAWAFFDEMDRVIAELVVWGGSDGFVITMSDHGFGPKEKTVNVNLALKEWGLLSLGGLGALGASGSVRRVGARVKKLLPKRAQLRAKTAAQAAIDWSKTKAFSSPVPQQGIYVNLKGREPHGIVPERDYEAVRDEVIAGFESFVDPDDGKPVADHVYRREDVIDGPEARNAPDLFPVCRAYSYELFDGLFSPAVLGDSRDLPRGFHHMDGIFAITGPGVAPRTGETARLYDIAPTALYLAGYKIPEVDGRVLRDFLPRDLLMTRPIEIEPMNLPRAGAGVEASPYSAEEQAQIEESLRNLGYL